MRDGFWYLDDIHPVASLYYLRKWEQSSPSRLIDFMAACSYFMACGRRRQINHISGSDNKSRTQVCERWLYNHFNQHGLAKPTWGLGKVYIAISISIYWMLLLMHGRTLASQWLTRHLILGTNNYMPKKLCMGILILDLISDQLCFWEGPQVLFRHCILNGFSLS